MFDKKAAGDIIRSLFYWNVLIWVLSNYFFESLPKFWFSGSNTYSQVLMHNSLTKNIK
jgi:hypothetical protein